MNRHIFIVAQLILLIFIGYWWYALIWQSPNGGGTTMRVHFLDVGQGDAVLIETPNGRQILVDAGRGIQVLNELQNILNIRDRDIDGVILTHPDADHVGGFVPVLKQYEVGTVIRSFVESKTSVYRKVKEEIQKQKENNDTEVFVINRPYSFTLDGVSFRILWPIGEEVRETNAASVVLLVTYGDIKTLLTGDANAAVEDMVAEAFPDETEDVDILKAGHHGSNTSTSAEFLNHTKPNVIVYSASKNNRYGHPHPAVIERVETYGKRHPGENLQDYWTAEDGTVSLCITEQTFTLCR